MYRTPMGSGNMFPRRSPLLAHPVIDSSVMALTSSSLLIALFRVPSDYEDADDEYTYNDRATSLTAVILIATVLTTSILSLVVQSITFWKTDGSDATRNGDEGSICVFYRQQMWSRSSLLLLMGPAFALGLLLVLRLFLGANSFQGSPKAFDFGWKYGLLPHARTVENDGDELYNEPAEKNVACIVEFNSYGHMIQGVVCALLSFPWLQRLLLVDAVSRLASIWNQFVHLAPFACCLYPTYNIIKRMNKAREAFAASSFSNNALEWVAGFWVAYAVGMLVVHALVWLQARPSSDNSEESGYRDMEAQSQASSKLRERFGLNLCSRRKDKQSSARAMSCKKDVRDVRVADDDTSTDPNRCTIILQLIMGFSLLLTTIVASFFMTWTWLGCLDGSPDECVNVEGESPASPVLFGVLMGLPCITLILVSFAVYRQGRE